MRRLLSFIVALALLLGGLCLLLLHIANSDMIYGRFLAGCGFMMAIGGYWLWEDFLAPLFQRKSGTMN